MRQHTLRTTIAAVGATLALTGLAACGSDDSDDAAPAETSSAPATEETEEAPATSEGTPAWANEASTDGDKIASFKVGDLAVDVYQVGVEKATKTGQFVNPEDNKPIIAEGDDIVFVNYVVTNTGDPVDLGSSIISIDARYENWPYMQGMDGVVDSALYEKLNVFSSAVKVGESQDPPVYTLGKNETFAYGENFRYEPDTKITFKARATPVDAEGKLLHENKVEGEGTGTIK